MSEICKNRQEAEEILEELCYYILECNINYCLMVCVAENERAIEYGVIKTALTATFLHITYRCFLFNILNILHRMYDDDASDAISISRVIKSIGRNIDSYTDLEDSNKENIKSAIKEFKVRVKTKRINHLKHNLKDLRNMRLAHFISKYFLGNQIDNKTDLTLGDLKTLIDHIDMVVKSLYFHVTGKVYNTHLPDIGDIGKIYSTANEFFCDLVLERERLGYNKENHT